MTATDITALTASIHDPLARAALADWLEEIGDDDASDMVRTMHDELLPILEARRTLAEVGHVRCYMLRFTAGGSWCWTDFRPRESHPEPTERPITPRMPRLAFYTYEEIRRGDSVWLARIFRRAVGAERPGDVALRDATLAFFGMERITPRSLSNTPLCLEMSR